MQKLGQITNANILINDVDVAGLVTEFSLDEIATTEVEHKALGMIGVLKLPGRPLKAIGGSLKIAWLDDALERAFLNPTIRHKLQLHSYVDVLGPEGLDAEKSHTLVTHLGFHILSRESVNAKLGEQMGTGFKLSVISFTQKIYGQSTPIIEFDAFAQTYKVDGKDVWPS